PSNVGRWPINGAAGSGAFQPRVHRITGWSSSPRHGIAPASTSSHRASHYAPTYPLMTSNNFPLQPLTQAYGLTSGLQSENPVNHLRNPNVPGSEAQFDMNMDVLFDSSAIRTPLPLMGGPIAINNPSVPPLLPFNDSLYPQAQFPAMSFNISDAINIGVPLEPQQVMPIDTFALDEGPQIHKFFNKARSQQTSGDDSIGDSVLFGSDVPAKRLGVPYLEAHWGTGFVQSQPIIHLDENDEEPPLNESERDAILSASQVARREAEMAEEGIKVFCTQSFPDNAPLQEKLKEIMQTPEEGFRKEELAVFLQMTEHGKEKRWKCLFSGPCGPCTFDIKRRDGAIGHILEKHLRLFPIECGGECGDMNCTLRFGTAGSKNSHTRKGLQ
ncbi:hypothetical protein FRC17_008887, partial [Serendipita sp. 399]